MGGGGGETTSTVYQNSIPEWAQPYLEDALSRGQAESTRPYQPYAGQRVASQDPNTVAGLSALQRYGTSGIAGLQDAQSLAGAVGSRAMDLQNYVAGGVDNTYTDNQFGADQVESGTFGAAERDQYMSPYMEAVVTSSQQDAQAKALQEQAYIKAQQGTTGAFGGSRGAVQQQIAANEAQKRISDIGVQGRQAAFENAQEQFERDQGRGLQADLANQAKNLEAAGMTDDSQRAATEFGMKAQESTEQLRQSGKQLGISGLQIAGDTASQLAAMQQMKDQMQLDRANALVGVGNYQQSYQQQQLDQAYNDFLNQQNYPLQRLNIVPSMLPGAAQVAQGSGSSSTTTPSNPMQAAAGTALAYDALQRLGRGSTA